MSSPEKSGEILRKEHIAVNCGPEGYEEVIRRCGRMLVDAGYVSEPYIESMLDRDRVVSTAIGNFLAIPHGTNEGKQYVLQTGLVVLTYPQGLDWNGERVKIVVGIAAMDGQHLDVLSRIAEAFETESAVEELVNSADPDKIHAALAG